jgi:2-C-methyl-D-erythritol 4-phosphate cytidylyltransferase
MAEPVVAVVVAAGAGVRLGGSAPKALRQLSGRSLVRHSLDALAAGGVDRAVVVIAAGTEAAFEIDLADAALPTSYVLGGVRRQDSVRAGLAAIAGDPDAAGCRFVLVHDAARPLVPPAVVARVVEALAAGSEAVVPAVPVVDSIRSVDSSGVSRVVDRSVLRAVQTPQGFVRQVLEAALSRADADGREVSDDATAVEAIGVPVRLVDGSAEALKVTGPADLAVAEAILAGRR